jgi:hypothetical protein
MTAGIAPKVLESDENIESITKIIHELSQPGEAWLKNILNAMDYWNVEPGTLELTDCIFTETAKVSRNMFFRHTSPGFIYPG